MKYHKYTLEQYVAELSGGDATPGGGSAAALIGTLGAALVSMVGHLTVGRKKYAAVEGDMQEMNAAVAKLQGRLLELVSEDTEAFETVMAAYRLPKATDEEKAQRKVAIDEALRTACAVPLTAADTALEVLRWAKLAAEKGNTNAVSDAAVGGYAAMTALQSALLNVRINLNMLPADDWSAQTRERVASLTSQGQALLDEVVAITDRILDA